MPRYPIRRGDQRRVDLVNITFCHAGPRMSYQGFDSRDGKPNVFGRGTERMAQAVAGDTGNVVATAGYAGLRRYGTELLEPWAKSPATLAGLFSLSADLNFGLSSYSRKIPSKRPCP